MLIEMIENKKYLDVGICQNLGKYNIGSNASDINYMPTLQYF